MAVCLVSKASVLSSWSLRSFHSVLSAVDADVDSIPDSWTLVNSFFKLSKKSVDNCNKLRDTDCVARTLQEIVEEAALTVRLTKAVPSISDLAQEAGISRQELYRRLNRYNKQLEKDGEHGDQTITPQSSTEAVNNLNGIEHTAQTSTNGGA